MPSTHRESVLFGFNRIEFDACGFFVVVLHHGINIVDRYSCLDKAVQYYSMFDGVDKCSDIHGYYDGLVSLPKRAMSYDGAYPSGDVARVGPLLETVCSDR